MPNPDTQIDAATRQRETAARLYNQKVEEYAREYARRLGPAYGTKAVDWDRIVELWNTQDPDLDVDKVWDDAAKQAAEMIEADPSLDPEQVRAEIPVEVARRLFPKREEAIKAMGGTTYREWADNADEIERRAAKARPKQPDIPDALGDAVSDVAGVSGPEGMDGEVETEPPPPLGSEPSPSLAPPPGSPVGPGPATGGPPPPMPGVGQPTPLMQRPPGTL